MDFVGHGIILKNYLLYIYVRKTHNCKKVQFHHHVFAPKANSFRINSSVFSSKEANVYIGSRHTVYHTNNQRMHVISSRIIVQGHGKYKRITNRELPI